MRCAAHFSIEIHCFSDQCLSQQKKYLKTVIFSWFVGNKNCKILTLYRAVGRGEQKIIACIFRHKHSSPLPNSYATVASPIVTPLYSYPNYDAMGNGVSLFSAWCKDIFAMLHSTFLYPYFIYIREALKRPSRNTVTAH